MPDFFTGKTAWLATMHQKEKWIGPVLEQALGLKVCSISGYNSDTLGTFSGDVERPGSQWETALMKLERAKDSCPEKDIFLASEGAFFPFPEMHFLTQNVEILVLKDFKNQVLVKGQHSEIGFPLWELETRKWEEVSPRIKGRNFWEEGLILKTKHRDKWLVFKDFNTEEEVKTAFENLRQYEGLISLGPDLRAHRNMRRQKNLVLAAEDLVKNAKSFCPKCQWPGFTMVQLKNGLPCGWCGLPTRKPKTELLQCFHCGHEAERPLPEKEADPSFCDFCNP